MNVVITCGLVRLAYQSKYLDIGLSRVVDELGDTTTSILESDLQSLSPT